jgi:hypothetical protein
LEGGLQRHLLGRRHLALAAMIDRLFCLSKRACLGFPVVEEVLLGEDVDALGKQSMVRKARAW